MLLFACLIVGAAVWKARHDLSEQWRSPGPGAEERVVLIPEGLPLSEIALRLSYAGVLRHPETFTLITRLDGKARAVQAGEYRIPAGASMSEVLAVITSGRGVERRFVVPEGWTVAQVVARLGATEGLVGRLRRVPEEGSLLPETYFYRWGEHPEDLLRRMEAAMDETLADLWSRRAEGLSLSEPREALILASIVERETARADERALVASVFHNRLRRDARLQADSTVVYALTGGRFPLGRPLTRADLSLEHAYNTYRVRGLPPGPIANAGRASLEAALHPAETSFYYFVSDGAGGHRFSSDLAEHNRNVQKLRALERARAAEAAERDAGQGAVEEAVPQ